MADKVQDKPENIKVKRFESRDLLIILLFLLIAFFFVGLFWNDLMQTLNLANVEPVGTVVIRKNTVQRRFASRVLWDRLSNESPVYVGDLIRIADVSAATLYIGGSSIELDENTLIRILLAPDGESIIIQIDSGEVSIVPTEESKKIFVEVNGKLTEAQPGEVLTAVVSERGEQVQTSEVTEWLENTGRLDYMTKAKVKLLSPAVNSLIRYQRTLPSIHFQWEELENALFYEIEISRNPEFNFPYIRESYLTPFMTETRIGDGVWFWRVRPVFSSVYNIDSVFSDISFLRIIKDEIVIDESINLSDWLASESPLMTEIPPNIPPELIPAYLRTPEPPPPVRTQPPVQPSVREPVQPVPNLPAPRNMLPDRGTVFGFEDLRSRSSIMFSWSPVPEATDYLLTIYQETSSGRRYILRNMSVAGISYIFDNLRLLDRGTFVWQVEAVARGRDRTIVRRGTPGESHFILDFPMPSPVQIESTGILYDN